MSAVAFLEAHKEGVVLLVKVVPRASRSEFLGVLDGRIKIRIAAPPVDSAANEELIRLLARTLQCPKSQIRLLQGRTARTKNLLVRGATLVDVARVLAQECS